MKNKKTDNTKTITTQTLPDDKNPLFLYSTTHTSLLSDIAQKRISARKLAIEELRKRGLDNEGRWTGFRER